MLPRALCISRKLNVDGCIRRVLYTVDCETVLCVLVTIIFVPYTKSLKGESRCGHIAERDGVHNYEVKTVGCW